MNKIYLDNNSTTQIDPDVLKMMLPYFNEKYGNPSSQSHAFGWEAKAAVDIAREKIAKLIHAKSHEIIFTSGATEANNLAISGVLINNQSKNHNTITSSIEHKAVLDIFEGINEKTGASDADTSAGKEFKKASDLRDSSPVSSFKTSS